MRCKDCGRELNDASVFCPFCGHKQIDIQLGKTLYEKRLKHFFVVKIILQILSLIALSFYLFVPIIKVDDVVSGSFFELGISSIKIIVNFASNTFAEFGDEATEVIAFLVGTFAIFIGPLYLLIFIKLIVTVVNFISSVHTLTDRSILTMVIDETENVNNGRLSKRKAVNYKKRRKIKGSAIFFLALIPISMVCLSGVEIMVDILVEFEFDFASFGFIVTLCSSSDSMANAMIAQMIPLMVIAFVNFVFSCIAYVFKVKTRFSILNRTR